MTGFVLACRFSRRSANGGAEFFQRKLPRAAQRYQFSFFIDDLRCGGREVGGNFEWNRKNAVDAAMQRGPGLCFQTGSLPRPANLHDVRVGMRHGHTAGEKMKACRRDGGNVANGTVRDRANAAERQQNTRVDFPEQRTDTGRGIDILKHHDARRRKGENMVPPVGAVEIAAPFRWRRRAANLHRYGIAEHRAQPGEKAPHAGVGEAFIAQARLKAFNGVGHRADVETPNGLQLFGRQGGLHCVVDNATNFGATFWPGLNCVWLPTTTRSFSRKPAFTSPFAGVSMPSVTWRSSISSFGLIT